MKKKSRAQVAAENYAMGRSQSEVSEGIRTAAFLAGAKWMKRVLYREIRRAQNYEPNEKRRHQTYEGIDLALKVIEREAKR